MEFAAKKTAYEKLLGEQHLDADKKLLEVKNPASPFLVTPVVDKKQAQSDMLWDLLDFVSPEEIEKNRPETAEEKAKRLAEKEAAAAAKAEAKKQAKVNALVDILTTDLSKAPQKVLAKFARELEVEAPDFKADTLRPLLIAFAEKQTPQIPAGDSPGLKGAQGEDGTIPEKAEAPKDTTPADEPEKKSEG